MNFMRFGRGGGKGAPGVKVDEIQAYHDQKSAKLGKPILMCQNGIVTSLMLIPFRNVARSQVRALQHVALCVLRAVRIAASLSSSSI